MNREKIKEKIEPYLNSTGGVYEEDYNKLFGHYSINDRVIILGFLYDYGVKIQKNYSKKEKVYVQKKL